MSMSGFEYAQVDEPAKYPFNPSQQATKNIPAFRLTKLYKSKRVVIAKCKSVGSHYFYGPSSAYNDTYPPELDRYVTRDEFRVLMGEINGQIGKYWPCTFSFIIAYACCILTCFFSLMLPKCCLDDVVKFLNYVLERWNETLNPRGVFVDWKRNCSGSFIEFSVKDTVYEKVSATSRDSESNFLTGEIELKIQP